MTFSLLFHGTRVSSHFHLSICLPSDILMKISWGFFPFPYCLSTYRHIIRMRITDNTLSPRKTPSRTPWHNMTSLPTTPRTTPTNCLMPISMKFIYTPSEWSCNLHFKLSIPNLSNDYFNYKKYTKFSFSRFPSASTVKYVYSSPPFILPAKIFSR